MMNSVLFEFTNPTLSSGITVDINRAFNSEYVRTQQQNKQIHINGRPTTIEVQQVDFHLPGEAKVALNATVLLPETDETNQVTFTATPHVSANGQSASLEDVQYGEAEELSPELTKALVDETTELLNLSNFDLEGMSLRIKSLEVEAGQLVLQAEAHVEQIPSA